MIGFPTEADAQRVIGGVRVVERWQRSPPPEAIPGGRPDPVQFLRLTGGPTSGLYPAVLTAFDAAAGTYTDHGEVRFRAAGGTGPDLASGTHVLARFTGATADGAYGLYEGGPVTMTSDSFTCLTDVEVEAEAECNGDGTITVTITLTKTTSTVTVRGVAVDVAVT